MYGQVSVEEKAENAQWLYMDMAHHHHFDIMLNAHDDVQLTALSTPGGNHAFLDQQLINATMLK